MSRFVRVALLGLALGAAVLLSGFSPETLKLTLALQGTGTGKWEINGRTLGDYFPRPSLVQHIQQPFTATDTLGAFDVKAHVDGGGMSGQAGAMRWQTGCVTTLRSANAKRHRRPTR